MSEKENNAAMREALVEIRKALLLDSGIGPCTAFHAEVDRLTSAALSAPPRNCDRFNTGDLKRDAQDAMEAMLDEGVAGYRGIAEYLLSPVARNGDNRRADNG